MSVQMPKDADAKSIPVLKPSRHQTVTDGNALSATTSVVRVFSSAGGTVTIGSGTVTIPAGGVEYFAVEIGDVIATTGAVEIVDMV